MEIKVCCQQLFAKGKSLTKFPLLQNFLMGRSIVFFVFSDTCWNLFDPSWALTLSNLVKSFAVFQADPGLPHWEFFAPLLYTLPPPLCSYCPACRIVAWYIHIWLWENFLRIVSCQRTLLILCAQLVPPGRRQGLAQVAPFFSPSKLLPFLFFFKAPSTQVLLWPLLLEPPWVEGKPCHLASLAHQLPHRCWGELQKIEIV